MFYGRISKYKGVELLIESFVELIKIRSDLKLIIAGKSNYDLNISQDVLNLLGDNLVILNRYITNSEVAYLMKSSTLLVCPYTDATQSGIIMTSIPFGIPVIVSDVGALPEQVISFECGNVLYNYNKSCLCDLILKSLNNFSPLFNIKNTNNNSISIKNTIISEYKNMVDNKHK